MLRDVEAVARSERDRLVKLAFVLTGRSDHAEDIVQAAFTRMLTRDVSQVEDLGHYIRKVVVNESLTWRRSLVRRDKLIDRLGDRSQSVDAAWLISNVDLSRALGGLSAKHRAVVVLRYYLDLDDAEIADIVDCEPATVRSRLSRAMRKLRAELDSEEPDHD